MTLKACVCVLELRPLHVSIVTCMAPPGELETLNVESVFRLRTAPDELLLLSGTGEGSRVAEAAKALLPADSIVVEDADAYAALTLIGDAAAEAFSRLSEIALNLGSAAAVRQGLVAQLPAKIVVAGGAIHVLVSSAVGHHLRARVGDACSDLGLREGSPYVFDPLSAKEAVL